MGDMNYTTSEFQFQIDGMDLHPRTARNLRMQYMLAANTLIPWLEKLHVFKNDHAVCEIGCAEGGVLAAFVNYGSNTALGTDIQGELLEKISKPIMKKLSLEMEFTKHDVIYEDIPEQWQEGFDVVILRDVIEHLDDAAIALKNIQRLLKPGGVVLITFPPYTSPFGGHQQLLDTVMGNIPFIHLLPGNLFQKIIERGQTVNQEEVRRLHKIRCSADKVKHAAAHAEMENLAERYFALRPVFKWKYNLPLPIVELTTFRMLPIVKALAMEAAFVFRKRK